MPIPILFDCDPGHDDGIALVMAHRSPAIELLGVTTTCGNAGIDRTTANALRILDFIGAGDVPVAQGCHRPLARPLVLGVADGPSGLEGSPYLPAATRGPVTQHAVDFLAERLMAAPDLLTVVATGPLSNLGLLGLKHPEALARIGQLVWMGGVYWRQSDIIAPTEFNAFCDPEALQIVLDARVPITMVGLDVTMQVLIEAPHYEELATIDTALGRLVHDWLRYYETRHRTAMGVGGAMHDPLALAAVIDPTLIRTRPAHVAVELSGTHTHGATVAEFWGGRGEPDNAHVACGVDAARFFALMFDLLRD